MCDFKKGQKLVDRKFFETISVGMSMSTSSIPEGMKRRRKSQAQINFEKVQKLRRLSDECVDHLTFGKKLSEDGQAMMDACESEGVWED